VRKREETAGRDLNYPPLPEPLTVPVYDNHTHLEIADGRDAIGFAEHLDRASSVGVRGVVQVGGDLETSRWSAEMALSEPRMLAAVAIHPNEAPAYEAAGTLDDALAEIAGRCRGTPRIANRLLRRVRDYALVHGEEADLGAVHAALELYDVDPIGLDRLDREVMQIILTRFGGGPVGLNTLAVSVGEESETIEAVVEPFLVRIGFLTRTPRGRVATPAAWRHFGLGDPQAALSLDHL
jgi:hypothetical protein